MKSGRRCTGLEARQQRPELRSALRCSTPPSRSTARLQKTSATFETAILRRRLGRFDAACVIETGR